MEIADTRQLTRRAFSGGAAFTLVPRHVLGGAGYVPPSDRINLASIGMGRQGMAVTMELLPRPELQVVAVCDCNQGSKDYAEYSANALLTQARRLLGPGYEQWGEDLASPGDGAAYAHLPNQPGHGRPRSGAPGGRSLLRLAESSPAPTRAAPPIATSANCWRKKRTWTRSMWPRPITGTRPSRIAAMQKRKHVLGQKPMTHSIGEARRMAADWRAK